MQRVGRRDLLLLLIGPEPSGLGGMTRLQKLLFLLEREEGLTESETGFEFEPYKAGPYSPQLYDDLEFLENLGYLTTVVTAEASDAEAAEIDRLSFDHLMSNEAEEAETSDTYEERRFQLTDEGKERVRHLLESGELQPLENKIRRIKSKYGRHSLNDLLYYVYTKYPDMTTESEIRDQVLRRGPQR